jgi:hypothetical protein
MSDITQRWSETIFDKPEMTYKEQPLCTFCEFDKDGDEKHCWFKPSPEVCQLCLIGELIAELQYLRGDYEAARKREEERSRG